MDLKIYTTYHKDEYITKYNLLETNNINKELFYSNDMTLEKINLNNKNQLFGEFVTLYYAYMNDELPEYIGFEHYRRRFTDDDMEKIQSSLSENTIVVGNYLEDQKIRKNFNIVHRNMKIYDICIDILNNKYGNNNIYTLYLDSPKNQTLYTNETFILHKSKFKELFNFVWKIILEIDKRIDGNNFDYDKYKTILDRKPKIGDYNFRIYGFLSERLISCWIINNYIKSDIHIINTKNVK
jgi:hypothetical protein